MRGALLLAAALTACHAEPVSSAKASVTTTDAVAAKAAARSARPPLPVTSSSTFAALPAAPRLPEGVTPGAAVDVDIAGDRPALVIHGPASVTRALVYLHGICGNLHAVESFAQRVSRSATLIALRGDSRCGRSDRFKWDSATSRLDQRVRGAVQAVKAARGGLLDETPLVVFGYSAGAPRAQALSQRYPDRYPWVVLGGDPLKPAPAGLLGARAVVVLASSGEPHDDMRTGATDLTRSGKPTRFVLLPNASHGHFGPQADVLVGEAVEWLIAR